MNDIVQIRIVKVCSICRRSSRSLFVSTTSAIIATLVAGGAKSKEGCNALTELWIKGIDEEVDAVVHRKN